MAGRNLGDTVEMILVQGGTFEGGFLLTDEFGGTIDSTWRGRLEIRTRHGGDPVATFASSGGDGTLTINDYGQVLLSLPSTFTATLTPTSDSLGLNTTSYVADVEVWQATSPSTHYKPETPFRVFVRPEVTTG